MNDEQEGCGKSLRPTSIAVYLVPDVGRVRLVARIFAIRCCPLSVLDIFGFRVLGRTSSTFQLELTTSLLRTKRCRGGDAKGNNGHGSTHGGAVCWHRSAVHAGY